MKKPIAMAGGAVLIAGAMTLATLVREPFMAELKNKTTPTYTPIPTQTYTPTSTFTPTPTFTPTSTPTPKIAQEFLVLRDDLASRINDYQNQGIDVAITITDLRNMQTIDVNGDVMMQPGCTGNTYAVLMLMDEVQKGIVDFSTIELEVREGVAYSHPNRIADAFIKAYDSVQVGIDKTQQYMISNGFPGTYDHIPASGGGTGVDNLTTSNAINNAFVRLYRGELFNPETTELTKSIFRDGIPAYLLYMLPEYIDYEWIMRKLGMFDDANGMPEIDCGIIKPYNREPYSICVITAGGAHTRERRGEGSFIIADLSKFIMEYMQNH